MGPPGAEAPRDDGLPTPGCPSWGHSRAPELCVLPLGWRRVGRGGLWTGWVREGPADPPLLWAPRWVQPCPRPCRNPVRPQLRTQHKPRSRAGAPCAVRCLAILSWGLSSDPLPVLQPRRPAMVPIPRDRPTWCTVSVICLSVLGPALAAPVSRASAWKPRGGSGVGVRCHV